MNPTVRRTLVIALIATAAVGCRGADPAETTGRTRSSELAAVTANTYPGALPAALDSLSGDALQGFVRTLPFSGGGVHKRPCSGTTGCDASPATDTTIVRIDGVTGQRNLAFNNLPAEGVVAAKLVNVGRFNERLLGVQADSSAHQYFLVVSRGPSDSVGTWRLEELNLAASGATHRTVQSGLIRGCMHLPDAASPTASFKTCDDAARDHAGLSPRNSDPSYTAGMWISCSMGCCSSGT